jgi:hypothetical protein
VLALSPDASHVITARYGPNVSELIALPLVGGVPVRLTDTAIAPGKGLSFSADGKRVAWSTCRSYANVVPLVEKDAAPPQAWEDLDGSRLPDGKLVVVSARDGTMKPWIIDPAGRSPPRALGTGMDVSDAAASADGSWVAATTPTGLALVSSGSKQPLRMLTTQAGDSEPNFTRDGRHVLFTRRAAGKVEIHRVSLANTEVSATGAMGSQAVAFDGSDDFLFIEERDGKSLPLVWRAARGISEPLSASLPPARYGRPDVSVDGMRVVLPSRGTEVIVVNRKSGRVERTLSMDGDQLDRPIFLSDGSLYVTRVRWLGDVWVADLANE